MPWSGHAPWPGSHGITFCLHPTPPMTKAKAFVGNSSPRLTDFLSPTALSWVLKRNIHLKQLKMGLKISEKMLTFIFAVVGSILTLFYQDLSGHIESDNLGFGDQKEHDELLAHDSQRLIFSTICRHCDRNQRKTSQHRTYYKDSNFALLESVKTWLKPSAQGTSTRVLTGNLDRKIKKSGRLSCGM